jgi:hypothetical protein
MLCRGARGLVARPPSQPRTMLMLAALVLALMQASATAAAASAAGSKPHIVSILQVLPSRSVQPYSSCSLALTASELQPSVPDAAPHSADPAGRSRVLRHRHPQPRSGSMDGQHHQPRQGGHRADQPLHALALFSDAPKLLDGPLADPSRRAAQRRRHGRHRPADELGLGQAARRGLPGALVR